MSCAGLSRRPFGGGVLRSRSGAAWPTPRSCETDAAKTAGSGGCGPGCRPGGRCTTCKHVGLLPEHAANWNFIYDNCVRMRAEERTPKVLNLFAYTGGATLAARAAGADTTHVDSVKQVVTWARENMEQSGLEGVRWIVEDALKFVQREVRRGNRYNGIILDPPAYGRGANGEKWILEDNIGEMLECCARLLEPRGAFLVLNLYSMGLSATLASTAVRQAFGTPFEEQFGELCFDDRAGKRLPLGTYCRFVR